MLEVQLLIWKNKEENYKQYVNNLVFLTYLLLLVLMTTKINSLMIFIKMNII